MSRRLPAGMVALTFAGLLLCCVPIVLRSTTAGAADGKEPAAKEAPGKDVFGTTKVWAIHLEIPAKEYEAMQPAAPAGFGLPGDAPPPPRAAREKRESERNLFGTGTRSRAELGYSISHRIVDI